MVTAEHNEYFYSGGLGHAVAGLGKALHEDSQYNLSFLMPAYDSVMEQGFEFEPTGNTISVGVDFADGRPQGYNDFELLKHAPSASDAERLLFRHIPKEGEQQYFENNLPGQKKKIYAQEQIKAKAFGAWNKAVAEHILASNYDLVLLNEWHTGFVASFLQQAREQGRPTPKMIFAVHNMGYTEPMEASLVDFLDLPRSQFTPEGMEYYGKVSPFKAGFEFSDFAYAVSEGYSKEVQSPRFSGDLAGLAQKKNRYGRLSGILNGIDEEQWDPQTGHQGKLEHNFSPQKMQGKALGKQQLQKDLGLKQSKDVPVFVMTSRVSQQKGMDYALGALREFLQNHDAQVILTGDADQEKYELELKKLSEDFPVKFKQMSFDPAMEHRLTAYGDFFLNAPWYEPSGLNQMFAMKNGTVPLVSSVGGLVDSVEDGVTGLRFDVHLEADGVATDTKKTRQSVTTILNQAYTMFKEDQSEYKKMQQAAMAQKNSWKSRLPKFKEMFRYVRDDSALRLQGRSCASEVISFAARP